MRVRVRVCMFMPNVFLMNVRCRFMVSNVRKTCFALFLIYSWKKNEY